MLSNTLKTVSVLLIVASLTMAFTFAPVKDNGPTSSGPVTPWAHTDEDSAVFEEDFESGWNDWVSVDVTAAGLQWHIDDFNAYAGDSWWCGDPALGGYDNHWLQYLVTPSFDFTSVNNAELTFKLFYALEDPSTASGQTGGEYDGWDGCNVWASINGGTSWLVVSPEFPEYNCTSLYSFGLEWGMGMGIRGWGGLSGGWVDATFDLSAAAGYTDVKFRIAFCSDPAFCTIDDPTLIGMFVDDVLIVDGIDTLLWNNADDPPVPSEFTLQSGESSGDWWMLDNATSHSPSTCATCDIDGHYNLSDALESPWLSIPEGYSSYFTFWVWCDMLDWDGDNNNTLEDYYMVEVSEDGVLWDYSTYGFYDYGDVGRPGAASVGWEEYLPGLAFNGNTSMDLSDYAGQDIQIRFRVTTDGDDDGGIGSGMHVDDFTVWSSSLFNDDVGAANLLVPFPTSLSNGSVDGSVNLKNYGREDQSSVAAFVRIDSTTLTPLIPWSQIPAGGTVSKDFSLDLVEIGEMYVDAYTQLSGDENTANDTSSAYYVEVTPEHYYELGYDGREISWIGSAFYYWSFDPGNGAMVRFDPAEHVIPEDFDITCAKMAFFSPGDFVIHVYDAGTTTVPGAELYSSTVSVTFAEVLPEWKMVDLTMIPEMADRTTPFWIWVESLNDTQAQITGDDVRFPGHYYTYNGSSATLSEMYEFYIRAIAEGSVGVGDEITLTPDRYELAQNFPNPFNPETSIKYSLAAAGHTTLRVYNMLGEEVAELFDGHQEAGVNEVVFDAGVLSSGIYFYRLESGDFSMTKKMVLMK